MEQIISFIQDNPIIAIIASYVVGGSTVWPILKRFVTSTPTKIDDAFMNAIEAFFAAKKGDLEKMTAAEIEARIPDRLLVEIIKLRKAKWAAAKKEK